MKTTKTVARGVALLDAKMPGWEKKIKLDKLELSSACDCVCAQIVTNKKGFVSRFEHGLSVLGLPVETYEEAKKYGFLAHGYGRSSWTRLTDEWTRVIRAKRRGEEITS